MWWTYRTVVWNHCQKAVLLRPSCHRDCWSTTKRSARREFQVLSRLVQQVDCYRLYFGRDILDLPKLITPLLELRQARKPLWSLLVSMGVFGHSTDRGKLGSRFALVTQEGHEGL